MKAITILQPWASLIASGAKNIETRSWATKYRGPIAIHAGKQKIKLKNFPEPIPRDLPRGAVIAIAELVDCEEMTMGKIVLWRDVYGKNEIAFGDFQPGRYAWILANVRPIRSVLAKGMQRLWDWKGDVIERT